MDYNLYDSNANMALCYRNLGNHAEALAIFNSLLMQNQKDYEVYSNIGLKCYDTNKDEEAVQNFLKALEIKKDGSVVARS